MGKGIEHWKDIEGYPNYEVSDLGNVRNKKTGRILRKMYTASGYCTVTLSNKCKPYKVGVQRLVMTTFAGMPNEKGIRAYHLDKDIDNNRKDNLTWRKVTGRRRDVKPRELRRVRCIETGEIFSSAREASEAMGIDTGNLSRVLNGKRKTAGKLHWVYED